MAHRDRVLGLLSRSQYGGVSVQMANKYEEQRQELQGGGGTRGSPGLGPWGGDDLSFVISFSIMFPYTF